MTDTRSSDIHPTEHAADAEALARLVDRHLAAYCDPDRERRAATVAAVWHDDGVLQDPPFDAIGPDAIAAATDAVLQHFPGHVFRRTTEVDAHHDSVRYGWALSSPDGAVALTGLDVATVRGERLVKVVGFFGDPAPLG